MRKLRLARGILPMEDLRRGAEVVRLASDLIECDEPVIDIEGRILDALGGDGAGALLKFHHKAEMLRAAGLVDILRETAASYLAQELEDRGLHAGIAPPGGAHGAVDDLAVVIAESRPGSA